MARDLRPVYTAPTEAAAQARFAEFTDTWGEQYPAITALWRSAWSEWPGSLAVTSAACLFEMNCCCRNSESELA
jgi:transposase-like protein